MIVEPEAWPPDPIERCQDGLRRAWEISGEGDCWFMRRSALERFFQEDSAATDLPDSWHKLLSISNLPPDALADLPAWLRFTERDFSLLVQWSEELGDRLDPTPASEFPELASTPIDRNTPPKIYRAVLAGSVSVAALAAFLLLGRFTSAESDKRLLAERRSAMLETELSRQRTEAELAKRRQLEAMGKLGSAVKSNALLQALLDKMRATKKPEIPGIDLRSLVIARTAGGRSAWDLRSPAFTALRQSPARLVWPKGPSIPATVQIFDAATKKRVWSHGTSLSDGGIALPAPLPLGRTYFWSVVAESEDEGFSNVPFYVISPSERKRLNAALGSARSDADRASLTAKFGLYEELGMVGISMRRRLALQ